MAGTIGKLNSDYNDTYVGDDLDSDTYHYTAQTFVAAGDHMQSLEFLADAYGPGPTAYHLLITTVKPLGGGEFQPGTVLKEVSLTEPFTGRNGLHTVHVDLNGLDLKPGVTYAFILDGYVTKGGDEDAIQVGYGDDQYSGGFAADLQVGTGRADDFNADWDEYSGDFDLAFLAVFSDEGNTIQGTKKDDRIDSGHSPKGQPRASDDDDTIFGKKGEDRLAGGDGYDHLDGGKHKDKLYGGADDDDLIGGKGIDNLYGGGGEDHFFLDFLFSPKSAKKNFDKIFNFGPDDVIYVKEDKAPALVSGVGLQVDDYFTLEGRKLLYDGIKIVKFKGVAPSTIDDIHIEFYF